METQTLPSVEC